MVKPVKMGIEIEYLMMTDSGGPIYSGWRRVDRSRYLGLKILEDAAKSLQPQINRTSDAIGHQNVYKFRDGKIMVPDTFTLLETVTAPSTSLDVLRNQLWDMKRALIDAAQRHGGSLVSGSACPIAYRYEDIARNGRVTANNAGMHIHLEAPNDKVKIKFCNLIMQVMPELTALGVNSPIYAKREAGLRSKRLEMSPLVGPSGVSPMEYDPDTPLQFDDQSNRYRYLTPYTKSKRTIELRGFDTPMTIDWAMAMAALVQCLGVKASRLFVDEQRNTVVGNNSKVRQQNFEAAMRLGLRAKFKVDGSFGVKLGDKRRKISFLYHGADGTGTTRYVPATTAVKRLLYYIEAEAYELGLVEYLTPLYRAVLSGKDQAELQLDWYRSLGYQGYVQRLRAEAAAEPTQGTKSKRDGRTYFTVRQVEKGADKSAIYLTAAGMRQTGTRQDAYLVISGPRGVVRAKVRKEDSGGATISLRDNEIRMGQKLRNQLGVSMYDPVVVGHKQFKPIVIERTNSGWSPQRAARLLRAGGM